MMIGIVYYSKDGSTRVLAEELQKQTDGKTIELTEKKVRKGVVGFVKGGYQAAKHKSSELVGQPWNDINGCPEIYICTPIWASNGTPAMNTFLNHVDLSGKEITIYTLMADPALKGVEKTHAHLTKRVEEKGGCVKKCIALHGAGPGKSADVQHLIDQLA
jgi:hypothetical protein